MLLCNRVTSFDVISFFFFILLIVSSINVNDLLQDSSKKMAASRHLGNQALMILLIGTIMSGISTVEHMFINYSYWSRQTVVTSDLYSMFRYVGPTIMGIGATVYVGCLITWCVQSVKKTKNDIYVRHVSTNMEFGIPGYVHPRRLSQFVYIYYKYYF